MNSEVMVWILPHENISRGRSRTAVISKMERFVIILNGWKPLTIITKHSILDVAAVLDPPMIMKHPSIVAPNIFIFISTQFTPMFHFYTFWKRQKTYGFCGVFRGYIKGKLAWNRLMKLSRIEAAVHMHLLALPQFGLVVYSLVFLDLQRPSWSWSLGMELLSNFHYSAALV